MRLIVTEKNNSAKKIAEILERRQGEGGRGLQGPVLHVVGRRRASTCAVGLKGHVMNPAFPDGYSNWQQTDLHDLIDAELIKEPTDKNVLRAVRKVAKDATSVVIATDFDREGELIGLEALSRSRREPGASKRRARRTARSSAPATRRSPRTRSSAPSPTSTSSPTTSPTPAPRARTST